MSIYAQGGGGGGGGMGGRGGKGTVSVCGVSATYGPDGKGGDGALGGKGAKGGFIQVTAGRIDRVKLMVLAHGGSGGQGGNGGRAGGRVDDYTGYGCEEYLGYYCGAAGAGTDGASGGDGGTVRVNAACGVEGPENDYQHNIQLRANGGYGGGAGSRGPSAFGGLGVNNISGGGGDGGTVVVTSPAVAKLGLEAKGGAGGKGSRAGYMLHSAFWASGCGPETPHPCQPAPFAGTCVVVSGPVDAGNGMHGGDGGVLKVFADQIDSPSLTADVSAGPGGGGGDTFNAGVAAGRNSCYWVREGQAGAAGEIGNYQTEGLGLDPDKVITLLGTNKLSAGPGECFEYTVNLLTQTPKNNVAARLKVPNGLEKVSAAPASPEEFQTGKIQWNVDQLLACRSRIFRLLVKVPADTRAEEFSTTAETLVNGIQVSSSDPLMVDVDHQQLCSGSCGCTPYDEWNDVPLPPPDTPGGAALAMLNDLLAFMADAKKALPPKPAPGSSKKKRQLYKEKKQKIVKARNDVKAKLKSLLALGTQSEAEIKAVLPEFSLSELKALQRLVKKGLTGSPPALAKRSWRKAIEVAGRLRGG